MPNLGFITPGERTTRQADAHAAIVQKMPRFALSAPAVAAGTKVMLSDFWRKPEVVQETGVDFDRAPFQQLTGSCVGAGGGNALYTLICVQRLLSEGATKAFVPWWPFSYGRSRLLMGDRGQGEGSLGSTFADTIVKEGVVAASEPGLPAFKNGDGYVLTTQLEMQWSDGDSKPCVDYLDEAKPHPIGTAAEMRQPQDMKAAILNGYPGSFACNNYIGQAAVRGDALLGRWDGSGGHQQWFFGYWEHPDLGPLYAIGNNWARETYPRDPGGLPLVCCWVKETDVAAAFRLDAEVYAFSHLTYFPAQADKILDHTQYT